MAREYFQSRVESVGSLCGNVKHVVLRRVDGEPIPYKAGQFIMIHFPNPDGIEINRSYSISAQPEEIEDGYALCVKLVDGGQGSTLIHSLEPGDEIKTSGPHGRFTLREESPRDMIFVATGTGIAPFRSMQNDLAPILADSQRRVWVLMGVRYPEELLYHDEWQALAAKHDNLHYLYTVSRPRPEDAWAGATGYVSQFLEPIKEAIDPSETVVYLCGVPQMVNDMRTAFKDMGLGIRGIRCEKFVSPPDPKNRVPAPKKKEIKP